jgi:hypothetical protein
VRYIVLPIERDPVDAEEQGFEVFRAQFPGWQPADADPLTILVRATAVMDSEVAELASRMSEEAFRYFGRGLLGLPPVDDAPAIGTVRFTAQDASGPYVVPEDLEVAGRDATGTLRGFRVLSSAVIPNGSTTVDVAVEATEDGTVSEGISGAGEFLEYVDYLTAVEFIGTTEGATDRESDEAYLDRLAEELTLQAPRPIVPHDFAVLARTRRSSTRRGRRSTSPAPAPPCRAGIPPRWRSPRSSASRTTSRRRRGASGSTPARRWSGATFRSCGGARSTNSCSAWRASSSSTRCNSGRTAARCSRPAPT